MLKTSDFSESSRVLTCFSGELGLLRVSAKGVKRKGSKNLPVSQPFAFSRMELYRGKGDFYTLVSGEVIENFYGLASNYEAYTAAGRICGYVLDVAREELPDNETLRLLLNSLFTLAYGKQRPGVVESVFVIRLFYDMGFLPPGPELCAKKGIRCSEALNAALTHITEADLKQIFGFEISEDCAAELAKIADLVLKEEL